MATINQRGWTWIDESVDDDDADEAREKHRPELDALAAAWSTIHHNAEQAQFSRSRDFEDGCDREEPAPMRREYPRTPEGEAEFEADVAQYDAEIAAREAARRLAHDLERAQVEHIENRLAELGARMMRPYEHWNEDEARVQWEEVGRWA